MLVTCVASKRPLWTNPGSLYRNGITLNILLRKINKTMETRGERALSAAGDVSNNLEPTVAEIANFIPDLDPAKYKGQSGIVGVIGGCREYTGAPFFSAYSALKLGADLSHVFCTPGASPVIKSYSPELIVHPYLLESDQGDIYEKDRERSVQNIEAWLHKFDCVVVGPGLGRDPAIIDTVSVLIERIRERKIPMVIDADGLWIVKDNVDLVKGCNQVVLTPNVVEYTRLADVLGVDSNSDDGLQQICNVLDGPVIVRKGKEDVISGPGVAQLVCTAEGSPRRAGGQGDVLSGAIATFIAWNFSPRRTGTSSVRAIDTMMACYSGCLVARMASQKAFQKLRRSMGAMDLIKELGSVIESIENTKTIA